jgi:hypothetical protein
LTDGGRLGDTQAANVFDGNAAPARPRIKAMRIEAPVEEWEHWTDMKFPEDGDYVFPFGLSPLSVQGGVGSYWEPNVWKRHEVVQRR